MVDSHLRRTGSKWSVRTAGHPRAKARDLGVAKRMVEAQLGRTVIFEAVNFDSHWTGRVPTREERERLEQIGVAQPISDDAIRADAWYRQDL